MGIGLSLLAIVCAAGQEAKKGAGAREEFRISGVVVDAVTGLAVPGAELNTTGDLELRTVADGAGRFVFADVEPGKYRLLAVAPGYVKQGYNQHGGFFTGIAVGSGVDSEHLVFRLQQQAVIYGRVTDERGDAVRQATVWLFAEDTHSGKHSVEQRDQTQTNDEGAYRFAHLLPGKYYVGVIARPWYAENGLKYMKPQPVETGDSNVVTIGAPPSPDPMFDVVYPVTYFPGATDSAAAVPLMAKAGDAMDANIRMVAVPSIHVLLTNVIGSRRNGQNVGVSAVQQPFGVTQVPLSTTFTEISPGTFEVGGLPPGEVRLMLNRGGDESFDSHGVRVNASEGKTVDANSREAASVSGAVVGVDGNKTGMQGTIVLRKGDQEVASARLRKDGTFTLTGLEEGSYEVQVNLQGNADYVAKVTGSGAKVSGKTVAIEAAGEVKLVVTMGRGQGRVSGTVRTDGKPAGGVMVLLAPSAENLSEAEFADLVRIDQSDSDGTFTLAGILPGKYVLMAIEDGWELEWRDAAALKPYREKGMKMDVAAGEEKSVAVEGMKAVRTAENRKSQTEFGIRWARTASMFN
jgi:hypothetical protein